MKLPSLTVQILLAMLLGMAVGLSFGAPVAFLGGLGKLVIQLIKAMATPLLFLAIVHAIVQADVGLKNGLRMMLIATINASIALAIGLTLSNLLQPGRALQIDALAHLTTTPVAPVQKLDLLATLGSYVPANIVQPFIDNAIITIVVLAILCGCGLKQVRHTLAAAFESRKFKTLETLLALLLQMTETILAWIVRLVPLAVFGVVVKATAENGLAPLRGLSVYVGVGLLGLALHVITYHCWIIFVSRLTVREFWRAAREAVVYALGANSSLATLPLTLRALDRMGVSRSASALGACMGTNLNNDGVVLYEAMAVLFVAQAYGIQLDLGQQILAAFTCLVAAMGVAGIPEAGFISLAIVLATVGLPMELLPLLLTVDWIIARGRSVVNVLSDMVVSIALDRWAGARAA